MSSRVAVGHALIGILPPAPTIVDVRAAAETHSLPVRRPL